MNVYPINQEDGLEFILLTLAKVTVGSTAIVNPHCGHFRGLYRATILHPTFPGGHLDINYMMPHDVSMRTTLTLDDDIADSLKEQARLLNKPFKQIVNDALRRGLAPSTREDRATYTVRPLPGGFRAGVDPFKLNQLNDELETRDFTNRDVE